MKSALRHLAAASLFALPAFASSASAVTPGTLTDLSPAQILSTSLAAAAREGSATTIGTTTVLGLHLSETTTSGPRSGYGNETVNGHHGAVVFLHGVVYAKLDPHLVKLDYGVADDAVANRWISLTKASKFYAGLAAGITLTSVLQQMRPTGALSSTAVTTVDGVATVGVTGAISPALDATSGTETLYVADVAPFLPVRAVVRVSQSGVNATISLTPKNWGEPVTVLAPKVFTSVTRTNLG